MIALTVCMLSPLVVCCSCLLAVLDLLCLLSFQYGQTCFPSAVSQASLQHLGLIDILRACYFM